MPGQRQEAQRRSGKNYAWTRIWAGGEVERIETSGGGSRNIVKSRNSAEPGDEVSQSDLKVSDEEWQALLDGGAVRSYPMPEGADATTSPQQAFLRQIVDPSTGEVDPNQLMESALAGYQAAPPAEEEAEQPQGV